MDISCALDISAAKLCHIWARRAPKERYVMTVLLRLQELSEDLDNANDHKSSSDVKKLPIFCMSELGTVFVEDLVNTSISSFRDWTRSSM